MASLILLLFVLIEGKDFICDGDVLPIERINDNFCDCEDGSDEFLTGACPSSYFLCENSGFLPRPIPSAHVNDGVCDCCDGSDEKATSGSGSSSSSPCTNTCKKQSREFLKSSKNHIVLYQQGVETKKNMFKESVELQKKLGAQLETLDQILEGQSKVLQKISQESQDDSQRLQKKYDYLLEQEAKLGVGPEDEIPLRVQFEAEKAQYLERDAPRRDYHKMLYEQFLANRDAYTNIGQLLNTKIGVNDEFFGLLSLHGNCYSYFYDVKQYGAHGLKVDHYRMELCPFHNVTQHSLLEQEQEEKTGEDKEESEDEEDAEESENEGDSTDGATAPQEKKKAEVYLLGLWDFQLQVKNNDDYELGMISYENSLADETTADDDNEDQGKKKKDGKKQKKKKKERSLRKVTRVSSTVSPPTFVTSFTRGDGCWNGPKRSADVFIHCGVENKIKEVVENGRCHYEFIFESPGACNERILKLSKQIFKLQKASFTPKDKTLPPKEDL